MKKICVLLHNLPLFQIYNFQQNLLLTDLCVFYGNEFRLVNEGGVLPKLPSFLSALDLPRYNPRNVTTNLLRPKQCSTLYYC